MLNIFDWRKWFVGEAFVRRRRRREATQSALAGFRGEAPEKFAGFSTLEYRKH